MLSETKQLGASLTHVQLLIILSKIVLFILHGNHIATYNYANKELSLYDGGWQSNTTKSRLNALCNEFATGFGVFQKNWDWFISDFQNVKKEFVDNTIVNYNGCWE